MNLLLILWRQRALIGVLVRRDLAARYRASALGFVWSMVNPLLLLLVYSVVFTTVFQPRFPGGQPYPLFLFVGLLPWLFFSGTVLDAAITLIDNGPLLAKVMCPPEIFPAVTVLSQLVHHLLALPVLIGALALASVAGWHPFPWTIIFLPLAIIPWVLAAGGVAIGISAAAVHYRDLRDLVGHLLNLLFFASPIIYSLDGLDLHPMLMKALRLNPMVSLVTVYRDLAFAGTVPELKTMAFAMGVGVSAWIIGTLVFSRMRDGLVEAV
ncbi:MAG: ABC transporter permease [Thermoanaerobaculales bacterium]|nr:ABC transporter permease [Thermoanaerobaculales bacterium]